MRGYHEIARTRNCYGLFILWEHDFFGDEAPAIVTRNGVKVGTTWDDLQTYLDDAGYNV